MFLTVWFALASLWIAGFSVVGEASKFRHWSNALFPIASLTAITALAAAPANYDVVDKSRYALEFESLSFAPINEVFYASITDGREPAFLLFNWMIGVFTHDTSVYFLVTAASCGIMLVVTLWLVFGSGWQTAVVLYVTFCFGFFMDYSSFLLRQGLSISFLFLALALVLRKARMVWIVLALGIGVLFHWSAFAAAVLILLVRLVRLRTDILLGVWALFSALYFTGLNGRLAEPLSSSVDLVETYSDPELEETYVGGTNRPSFWLFSAGPLLIAYGAIKRFDSLPEWYPKLVNAFILLNCYFLCMGFVYFSDRLAAYSWSLVPALVSIPFLTYQGRGQKVARLCLLLAFTVWAVYFGSFEVLVQQ